MNSAPSTKAKPQIPQILREITPQLKEKAASPQRVIDKVLHAAGHQPAIAQKVLHLVCHSPEYIAFGSEVAVLRQLLANSGDPELQAILAKIPDGSIIMPSAISSSYQLERELEQRRFERVYLARSLDAPQAPLRKVREIIPQSTTPQVVQAASDRFQRELDLLARLSRDVAHFPTTIDARHEYGRFYVVEETIDGVPIGEEFAAGKHLGEQEVQRLLWSALQILDRAHRLGVLHRQIDALHLLRLPNGEAVLTNFGGLSEIGVLALSPDGTVVPSEAVGTPGYVPLEQLEGHPTPSSDLYGLGVICIQALTGCEFAAKLPRDMRTNELVWRQRAQVSADFADFIDRLTRYHSRDRYASAADALVDLERLNPELARPLPPPPEPSVAETEIAAPVSAGSLPVNAIAFVVALLVGGVLAIGGVRLFVADRSNPPPVEAESR